MVICINRSLLYRFPSSLETIIVDYLVWNFAQNSMTAKMIALLNKTGMDQNWLPFDDKWVDDTEYVDRVPITAMTKSVHWTIDQYDRLVILVRTQQEPWTNFKELSEEELKANYCFTGEQMKKWAGQICVESFFQRYTGQHDTYVAAITGSRKINTCYSFSFANWGSSKLIQGDKYEALVQLLTTGSCICENNTWKVSLV